MVATQGLFEAEFYQNENGVEEMLRERCRLIQLAFLESEKRCSLKTILFPFFKTFELKVGQLSIGRHSFTKKVMANLFKNLREKLKGLGQQRLLKAKRRNLTRKQSLLEISKGKVQPRSKDNSQLWKLFV
jgi:hypothetical protein